MYWKEKEVQDVGRQKQKQPNGNQVDQVPMRRTVAGDMGPAAAKSSVQDGQHVTNPSISYFTCSSTVPCPDTLTLPTPPAATAAT